MGYQVETTEGTFAVGISTVDDARKYERDGGHDR